MGTFADRVVLITGAASGIGRQLARDLAAEGAAVAGLDRAADALKSLETELSGRRVATEVADVTDRPALDAAVGRLTARLGPVDVLIAGAGVGKETAAASFNAADFEDIVRVNLVGVANSIAAVLPGMLARKSGHLAALSSLASFRGIPKIGAYSASKAGVNALLDAFRLELRPHGIAVTTICPGWIRTPMTADLDLPAREVMEVAEAARHILNALRRRRAFVAFPRHQARSVRLLRILPCGASDWLAARAFRRLLESV
jgi:short-subunit dehydrogenase